MTEEAWRIGADFLRALHDPNGGSDAAAAVIAAAMAADKARIVELEAENAIYRQIGRWEMAWEIALQLEQPVQDCNPGTPEQPAFDKAAKLTSMSIAVKTKAAYDDLPLEVQFGEGKWAAIIEAARATLTSEADNADT